MKKQLKKKLKKIVQANCTELRTITLNLSKENYASDLRDIRDFLYLEKKFKLISMEVLDNDIVILSVKWRGLEFGNYYIY